MADETTVCFVSLRTYAYFDRDTDVPPGGAERQLYLVGQELKSEFDVHFVVGDFGQPREQSRDGVTLHRAYEPAVDASVTERARQLVRLFLAMRRVDADVYVFRGEHGRAIVTYGLASLLDGSWVYNLALDSHAATDGTPFAGPVQYVFGRVLADADEVIAQTPRQRDAIASALDIDPTVVPNGYPPLEEFVPYPEREFLLYVGRIDESQKRTHLFLEAARRLPDISFALAGAGEGTAYCDRIQREANALPNVEFLGRVDPDEIHDYFRRAIALVNTSSTEGFPNTFLEAWRAGTPVVSLDVDPGRFLDADGRGYAEGEFDQLLSLCRTVAASTETRRALGEPSYEYFTRHYHISAVAKQYAKALRNSVVSPA